MARVPCHSPGGSILQCFWTSRGNRSSWRALPQRDGACGLKTTMGLSWKMMQPEWDLHRGWMRRMPGAYSSHAFGIPDPVVQTLRCRNGVMKQGAKFLTCGGSQWDLAPTVSVYFFQSKLPNFWKLNPGCIVIHWGWNLPRPDPNVIT